MILLIFVDEITSGQKDSVLLGLWICEESRHLIFILEGVRWSRTPFVDNSIMIKIVCPNYHGLAIKLI